MGNDGADSLTGVYGSSKAAIQFLSESLRLEVEPLGIKVLTVVAGSIKTNFFTPINEAYNMPPASYYSSLKAALTEKASGKADFKPSTMTAEAFGQAVAKDVLGGKTGNTYRGSMAWAVPVMEMMPKFVQVCCLLISPCRGLNMTMIWRLNAFDRIGFAGTSDVSRSSNRESTNRGRIICSEGILIVLIWSIAKSVS